MRRPIVSYFVYIFIRLTHPCLQFLCKGNVPYRNEDVSNLEASKMIVDDNERLKSLAEDFVCLFVFGATVPSGPGPPHSRGF